MKLQNFFLIAVFVVFTGYSATVVIDHGVTGFVDVAMAGGWALQILIDLCIALTAFMVWMFGDAKERGIAAWPYAIGIVCTGSVAALAYLVHRSFRERSGATGARPAHA